MDDVSNMKKRRFSRKVDLMLIMVVSGVIINMAGSWLNHHVEWPIYLDTVGTVMVAALGGSIPGILTAFLSNAVGTLLFGSETIFYTVLNILMAMATSYMLSRRIRDSRKKILRVIGLTFVLSLIGGGLGSLITFEMYGISSEGFPADAIAWCIQTFGMPRFAAFFLITWALDLVDKTITVLIAVLSLHLIPEKIKRILWFQGWRQTPISQEELDRTRNMDLPGISIGRKIAMIIVFTVLSIAISMTWVSSGVFSHYTQEESRDIARGAAELAADAIDPEMVDEYIREGDSAPGYTETEEHLMQIRDSIPKLQYVYVYQIRKDGCHVVFDLDTEDMTGLEPGETVSFDESFRDRIPDLLAGKEIRPMETDDTYGWLLTVYQPVYDKAGKCVCYAAADISMDHLRDYKQEFILREILIFLGFFLLTCAIGQHIFRYHIIYPVVSMTSRVSDFAFSDANEEEIDNYMKRVRDLKINTGDEVEDLYTAVCKMGGDSIDHQKNIRRQAETIRQMEHGLVMVMADIVEGRDSDTGHHIQRTAAYARIIMDSLRRKGYYADQLTDQYISNVEQSAPLHDLGKINISDVILNKPGRLTDEEFDIMKTHTVEGGRILEEAARKVRGGSYLEEAINLANYHHEKWNGKGYPEGLSGEDIPLSARVMAVADVFDALTSKRVYKDAMPFAQAVDIIREDAGSHFDPLCVEAFLDSLGEVKKVMEEFRDEDAE